MCPGWRRYINDSIWMLLASSCYRTIVFLMQKLRIMHPFWTQLLEDFPFIGWDDEYWGRYQARRSSSHHQCYGWKGDQTVRFLDYDRLSIVLVTFPDSISRSYNSLSGNVNVNGAVNIEETVGQLPDQEFHEEVGTSMAIIRSPTRISLMPWTSFLGPLSTIGQEIIMI